jgi:hypothetical protein
MRAGHSITSFPRDPASRRARNFVTSLQKVRDEATRELMSAFYRALWVDGVKSKSQALWRAKCGLRARRAIFGSKWELKAPARPSVTIAWGATPHL